MKRFTIPIYISNKKTYFLDKNKNFCVENQKKRLFKNENIDEEIFENHIINLFSKHKVNNTFLNFKIIVFIDFYNKLNKNIIKEILQKHFFNKIIIKKSIFLDNENLKIFITRNFLIITNNKIQKILNFNIFYNKKDILKGIIKYIYYSIENFQKKVIIYGDSIYAKKIIKLNPKFLYIADFNELIKEKLLKSI